MIELSGYNTNAHNKEKADLVDMLDMTSMWTRKYKERIAESEWHIMLTQRAIKRACRDYSIPMVTVHGGHCCSYGCERHREINRGLLPVH